MRSYSKVLIKNTFFIKILQLFNDQPGETTSEMCSVATKLELKDENLQTSWLNDEHKKELSTLLDKTQGWQKLAKHLGVEYLLQPFQYSSTSPSLILLNYIDVSYIFYYYETTEILNGKKYTKFFR